jgi:predicted dehydrogenase
MSEGPIYRAGIVGLGFIGGADAVSGAALGQSLTILDGTHAGCLTRNPRVKLVAGSSRDPGRRERFTERTGVPTYSDWREMLAREQLDLVSVATYAPQHAEVVCAAAREGIRAIYCEKPVAQRLVEADAMLRSCAETGALLVFNHNRRFNPAYRSLRARVAAGELGRLTSCGLRWGTGRLGNVGSHFIDALMLVTGRQVEAVSGTLDLSGKPDCRGSAFRDPGGWGVLRLEGGLMATVDAADYGAGMPELVLYGTDGRALGGPWDIRLELSGGRVETLVGSRPENNSMDRAVAEIVAWLESGAPFSYPVREALRTLETIVGFHVSHDRQGAWVELPLSGALRERQVHCG